MKKLIWAFILLTGCSSTLPERKTTQIPSPWPDFPLETTKDSSKGYNNILSIKRHKANYHEYYTFSYLKDESGEVKEESIYVTDTTIYLMINNVVRRPYISHYRESYWKYTKYTKYAENKYDLVEYWDRRRISNDYYQLYLHSINDIKVIK
jgi:hypothetical protein